MRNTEESEISNEDQAEIDAYKQLISIEGGNDLVDAIVNESIASAELDILEASLNLRNKEAYQQLLEEDL